MRVAVVMAAVARVAARAAVVKAAAARGVGVGTNRTGVHAGETRTARESRLAHLFEDLLLVVGH